MTTLEKAQAICRLHADVLWKGRTQSGKPFGLEQHEQAVKVEETVFANRGLKFSEMLAEAMVQKVKSLPSID